jgi:hypothetical protein
MHIYHELRWYIPHVSLFYYPTFIMHLTTCLSILCACHRHTLKFHMHIHLSHFTHACSQSFTCIFQRHIHFYFYNNKTFLLIYPLNNSHYLSLRNGVHPPQDNIQNKKIQTLLCRVNHVSMVLFRYGEYIGFLT